MKPALALAFFVVAAGSACSQKGGDHGCERALATRDWPAAETRCAAAGKGGHVQLARAWRALLTGQGEDAVALASLLLPSGLGPDAAYLLGHFHSHDDAGDAPALAKLRFEEAFIGFRVAARPDDAARAAGFLSRIATEQYHFEDALAWAQRAVAEADQAHDDGAQGRAETAVAETYDKVGLSEQAEQAFERAANLLARSPGELAYTYLKHGLFLLDLGDERSLHRALGYLDDSAALDASTPAPDQARAFARALNRADALIQLGDFAGAEAALLLMPTDEDHRRMLALVRGYLRARQGDLAAAKDAFEVADDGELELDFRWRVGYELGNTYRKHGLLAEAERAYADAVATVEQLRAAATTVELRPKILANRRQPYVGRFEVLLAQGRTVEALAVAESLRARSWLDVILTRPGATASAAGALRDAELRATAPAEAPLDAGAIMTKVGGREALVFVTMGKTTWRGHVVNGTVTFTALSSEDLDAVMRFRADPSKTAVAELAGKVLTPDIEAGPEPLYIVAGAPLADVAFAGLRRDGRYLVQHRSLVRVPGLTALGCRAGRWTDEQVFVGDATGDLQAAAAEVLRLGGPAARVGRQASRAAVLAARDAELLQVAVHGQVTLGGGVLILSDGPLTAADVLANGLAPRTVVLSGCSTAGSADPEDWSGFPSAFLASGSRAVIATVRTVKDSDAAAVSRAYHAQSTQRAPHARLAEAQREMIRTAAQVAWWSFDAWGDPSCMDGE